jgi:hypothetical protein
MSIPIVTSKHDLGKKSKYSVYLEMLPRGNVLSISEVTFCLLYFTLHTACLNCHLKHTLFSFPK